MISQDEYRTGTLGAADDVVEASLPGIATALVQLTGTFTATVAFELNVGQGSSPTWVGTPAQDVSDGTIADTAAAAGIYRVDVSGAREFRVRCSAYTDGEVEVAINASVAPSSQGLVSAVTLDAEGLEVSAATEYTEGDTDATITGIAAMWEDAGDTLRAVSAAKPLPVGVITSALPTGAATETTLASIDTALADVATETTLASIDTAVADVATETTLAALSKAEDAAHSSGDKGVMALAVRQDTQAALAGTTGDYTPQTTDANGSTRTVAGGYTAIIDTTLTRPANTTAYASGDAITDTGGTIRTLTNVARFSGGSGVIQGVLAAFSSNWATKPSLELWLYDTTRTPQSDNAAFAPSDSENDTLVAIIPLSSTYIGDATANSGNFVMDTGQISVPFKTNGSANLFMSVVARNAAQAGANSDTIKFRFRVAQD